MLDCFGGIVDMTFLVSSVESQIINSDTLKKFVCDPISGAFGYWGSYGYLEKVGSLHVIIENAAMCAYIPEITPEFLRCYEEKSLLNKTPNFLYYGDLDCQYQEPVSIERTKDADELIIYPLPAHNEITIEGLDLSGIIHIRNLTGEKVLTSLIEESVWIDLSLLESGMYLLEFHARNSNKVVVRKVVIL